MPAWGLSNILYLTNAAHLPRGLDGCQINAFDKDVVLAAESEVGRAVEADLHVPVPFLSRTICNLA